MTQCVFIQFICYLSECFSAEKYSSPNRHRFSSPSSLLSSLFLFLTGDNSAFCVEITVFSKIIQVNVKLIHPSGLEVVFFRYEVDYRSADVA